ncbi:hypothetical protein BJY52DRAFT_1190710 [Lactarius psammicola]|nr:hypothetical protein BJY52DRAFT_1190710 [Lactarius psammicola]
MPRIKSNGITDTDTPTVEERQGNTSNGHSKTSMQNRLNENRVAHRARSYEHCGLLPNQEVRTAVMAPLHGANYSRPPPEFVEGQEEYRDADDIYAPTFITDFHRQNLNATRRKTAALAAYIRRLHLSFSHLCLSPLASALNFDTSPHLSQLPSRPLGDLLPLAFVRLSTSSRTLLPVIRGQRRRPNPLYKCPKGFQPTTGEVARCHPELTIVTSQFPTQHIPSISTSSIAQYPTFSLPTVETMPLVRVDQHAQPQPGPPDD